MTEEQKLNLSCAVFLACLALAAYAPNVLTWLLVGCLGVLLVAGVVAVSAGVYRFAWGAPVFRRRRVRTRL